MKSLSEIHQAALDGMISPCDPRLSPVPPQHKHVRTVERQSAPYYLWNTGEQTGPISVERYNGRMAGATHTFCERCNWYRLRVKNRCGECDTPFQSYDKRSPEYRSLWRKIRAEERRRRRE